MKNSILIISMIMGVIGFSQTKKILDERKFAYDLLEQTYVELENTVGKLSEEELNYIPKDGGWSALNCLEHIFITEPVLILKVKRMIAEGNLQTDKDLSFNDWKVVTQVTDRTRKVDTAEPFRPKPENAKKTKDDFLAAIKSDRDELLNILYSSEADLRHLFAPYLYGEADAIQQAIIVGTHCYRHTMQINEIIEELYPEGEENIQK
ncbi:DinB family protein [Muricauda sp. CAU 1633]|uniref:DinB family protein n=1 Tax=Allomuricauda sp. CAU 1633 TaxID=2816036 RepID=UPI001A8D7271|nr:DinB family protein [Muricauda sp. CAU 1633]MBO0321540.1 DinB family protein [Muricauda sp. CAU 1633]